nr:hypothetical protein [Moritella viscosa]SHO17790.1 Acetyl-CoA acetyltransferase [Moritella viscosa]
MITNTTKELPYIIELPTSGSVAFIGDITHCSNYAARTHKHSDVTSLDDALSSTSVLPNNASSSVDLYYGSDDAYALDIRDDTTLVICVAESYRVAEKLLTAITESHPDIIVKHERGSDALGSSRESQLLTLSNQEVIDALEVMLLSDTSLAVKRQGYRDDLDTRINNILNPVQMTYEEFIELRERLNPI